MKTKLSLASFLTVVGLGFMFVCNNATAQSVTKVMDMNWAAGGGGGSFGPKGRLVPVGTNYWFLTENGGVFGFGGAFSFDPVANTQTEISSLGLDANTPYGSFTIADGKAWFTTTRGGAGDKGALSYIDTNSPGAPTSVFSFPNNNNAPGQANCGDSPRCTPLLIGNELWMLSSLGGSNSGGALIKYNLTNGVMTSVHHFTLNNGRLPFGSLVKQGDAYYFTTHEGGTNVGSGFPNGAGTMSRLTFDGLGNPIVTKLIDMPIGITGFPDGDVCSVGTNHLYFVANGNTANPGSLIRYDIANNTWSNMFSFSSATKTNLGASPNAATPVHVEGNLYFATMNGGTSDRGALLKFSIAENTMTKIANFIGGGNAESLGSRPQYQSGTYVPGTNNCDKKIYMFAFRGGANGPSATGNGTLFTINLGQPVVSVSNSSFTAKSLSWRGGYPPFAVQSATNVVSPVWVTEATGLTTNSITVNSTSSQKFYRVSASCQ